MIEVRLCGKKRAEKKRRKKAAELRHFKLHGAHA
jgi:hypothetical protein